VVHRMHYVFWLHYVWSTQWKTCFGLLPSPSCVITSTPSPPPLSIARIAAVPSEIALITLKVHAHFHAVQLHRKRQCSACVAYVWPGRNGMFWGSDAVCVFISTHVISTHVISTRNICTIINHTIYTMANKMLWFYLHTLLLPWLYHCSRIPGF
jgi:hypothetical protein